MKKRLIHITPLRAGIVLGIFYGCLSLIIVPLFVVVFLFEGKFGAADIVKIVVMAVIFPVLYTAVGFVGGIIAAAVYNLTARWTGGLEFQVRDLA